MPNRVTTTTTRSISEAYSMSSFSSYSSSSSSSSSSSKRTKFVVATPRWRELVIRPISSLQDELFILEEDTRDEAYVKLHRMIELKERYNLLAYEIRRANASSKKKKIFNAEELPSAEKMSAEELEETIARLEEKRRFAVTWSSETRPSRQKRKTRIRFTSASSASSSSSSYTILSDCSLSSLTTTSRSSSTSTTKSSLSSSSTPSSPTSPSPPTSSPSIILLDDCICLTTATTTTSASCSRPSMIDRVQAKQIQELDTAKLFSCNFTQESLESLAEEGSTKQDSKRAKLDPSTSSSSSSSYPSSAQQHQQQSQSQQQLKQIENIEKSAIEISLAQGKMLRTTKQEMNKSQSLDGLLSTSSSSNYSHFYRRIN